MARRRRPRRKRTAGQRAAFAAKARATRARNAAAYAAAHHGHKKPVSAKRKAASRKSLAKARAVALSHRRAHPRRRVFRIAVQRSRAHGGLSYLSAVRRAQRGSAGAHYTAAAVNAHFDRSRYRRRRRL